ncbi:MAG: tetratricopeptide repeat protein [Anaerolineaceae bacterium]
MASKIKFSSIVLIIAPLIATISLSIWPTPKVLDAAWSSLNQPVPAKENALRLKALKNIVEWQPENGAAWEQIGISAFYLDQCDLTELAFSKAEMNRVIGKESLFLLADCQLAESQSEAYLHTLAELSTHADLSSGDYQTIVSKLREAGDFGILSFTVNAWENKFPADNDAILWKSWILAATQPIEAYAYLKPVISKPEWSGNLRELYLTLQTLDYSQDLAYQLVVVGQLFSSIGIWDLAEVAFRNAIDISPDYAEAWALLGNALNRQNKPGYDALQTAERLSPNSAIVMVMQARYYHSIKDDQNAKKYLDRLLLSEPEEPAWQIEYGALLLDEGNLEKAAEYYIEAVNLAPQNPYYWKALAWFCLDNAIYIDSIGIYAAETALKLSPDDPAAYDVVGWSMYQLEDLESAADYLTKALKIDSTYALAYLHLGQVSFAQGKKELAKENFQNAYQYASDGETRKLAERFLNTNF